MTDPDDRFLSIDIGNTTVVVGLFDGDRLVDLWRLSSLSHRTGDEIALLLRGLLVDHLTGLERAGVGIASVVPALTTELDRACRRLFGHDPLLVSTDLELGIPIRYQDPTQIGPDRLANAVAVSAGYPCPAVVVDLGTTTNFDVIGEDGAFEGGAIAPGFFAASRDLFRAAARLPQVELAAPKSAIGRTTEAAIRSGVVYGTVGQIDGVVSRIAAELPRKPMVIATGGLADLVAAESTTIDTVDPALTLKGIREIWRRNRRL
jgi:type III pantothenate kinase